MVEVWNVRGITPIDNSDNIEKITYLKNIIELITNPTNETLQLGAEAVENIGSVWEGFSLQDAKCCYEAIISKNKLPEDIFLK